ncbi:histidine phosphatase family protein [Sporolactobacillus sp. KGMB 08714]|uniref:histidine phosphatase family protein n=1 Tax=Sporolactobacillus sp. KGMB 08714 TaxID=3064704 RepID=UPI002FBD98CF
MKTIKLYFVRHGETYFNQLGRFQGWSGTPLTERGIREAEHAGHLLKEIEFAAAYSSDTSRAEQTGQLILQQNRAAARPELVVLPELREHFYGGFEGCCKREAWQQIRNKLGIDGGELQWDYTPDDVQNLLHENDPDQLAETSAQFWERYERGLRQIGDQTPADGNALVITHSTVLRALVWRVTGQVPVPSIPSTGSVTIVSRTGTQMVLLAYNQTGISENRQTEQ